MSYESTINIQPFNPKLMKTLLLTFSFILAIINTFAQNAYVTALAGAVTELQNARNPTELQTTINKLERIAGSETKEYPPRYYAAQGYIQMSFMEKEGGKKDQLLDRAQQHLDQALKLQPNESELYALQGFLHQGRISVDAMNRGQQYAGLAMQALEKAKTLNPENPRVYYLIGQNLFYTPAMFGGGPAAALPLLTQAKQKFEQFKPASAVAPTWGLATNNILLEKCQANVAEAK
jgi:tetratricopeptide (TPR) repeat protein